MLNRNDDTNDIKKLMLFCVAAASTVLLLFLVALYLHDNSSNKKYMAKPDASSKLDSETDKTNDDSENDEVSDDLSVGNQNVVSDDLDFWDMYDTDERKPIEDIKDEENEKERIIEDRAREAALSIKGSSSSKEDENEEKPKTKNTDTRIKAKSREGSESWYDILSEINKNTYDFEEYLGYENGLLKYNSSAVRSYSGIDLSNKSGIVDFEKINNAGIDYVMIKVGMRAPDTGMLSVDDKFVEYANGATAAGLPMGAIFCSHAITDVEAVEEANFVVAAVANYNLKLPIAIDLSSASNSSTRADRLTRPERTSIVKKFCETVKTFGKKPIICANKDMLIADLDLEELKEYDIWLKDEAITADSHKKRSDAEEDAKKKDSNKAGSSSNTDETSDSDEDNYIGTNYPYAFEMWQYTQSGTIDGVSQDANLNISFVNYMN